MLAGTRFICHKRGLDAGKDGWTLLTMSLLAELLEFLVPVLETMASEAASLGLEVNWQKTKVQALGSRGNVPSTTVPQFSVKRLQ